MTKHESQAAASDQPTIAAALRLATERLREGGSPSPRLDAEVLLRHVLGLDRTGLFLRLGEPLANDAASGFKELIEARAAGEPVVYLTGEREFMGLAFAVGPGVLVPRPETEILVEWALGWVAKRRTPPIIADVGTGPGTIALSLAHFLDSDIPPILAIDLSDEALRYAERNRARLGLEERVSLLPGDLLAPVTGQVDLILANLPYLRPEQIAENRDLAWEPRVALDGGEGGLAAIARLLRDAPRVLASDGAIGLEIDPSQAPEVEEMALKVFPDATVEIVNDLAGDARFVIVQRSPSRSDRPQ